MGSGSESQQQQTQQPGTLSPVTATALALFGAQPTVSQGQFVPTTFGQGGVFSPESFQAVGGLLENIPATATERAVAGGGVQDLGFLEALRSQGLLQQGAGAFSGLLAGPEAAISAARRGFSEETVPAILERAPGFSSSDLQRELTRAGVDLETNVAALREANLAQNLANLPAFAQAVGSNLLDQTAQVLGFGQLGREFIREVSPAGDAFRLLSAFQALTGPALTTFGQGTGESKRTGVFA